MQQSSATPKNLDVRREGVAEDCCMLSILLAVPLCFWHSVIPTSYFVFILVDDTMGLLMCSSHTFPSHTVEPLIKDCIKDHIVEYFQPTKDKMICPNVSVIRGSKGRVAPLHH